MWLIKGIVGLFFIFLAVSSLVMAIEKPIAAIPAIIFASIGLWIMGWVSIFSPKHIQEKNIQDEIKARKSRYFGLRNRLMGLVAVAISIGGFYVMYEQLKTQSWEWENWKLLAGAIMFLALGIFYLIRGKHAELHEPRNATSPPGRNKKESQ